MKPGAFDWLELILGWFVVYFFYCFIAEKPLNWVIK